MLTPSSNCFAHAFLSNIHMIGGEGHGTYLNTETSQSQEWFLQAMPKQIVADIHTAKVMAMQSLDTLWFPLCEREYP